MRVLNRQQFLACPAGTIYAKGVQWAFDGLCVKGESMAHKWNAKGPLLDSMDWYYLNPAWVSARDSGEAAGRLDQMLTQGASFPMEDAEGRDGYFDSDAVFLVFERADLLVLRDLIDRAILASPWVKP